MSVTTSPAKATSPKMRNHGLKDSLENCGVGRPRAASSYAILKSLPSRSICDDCVRITSRVSRPVTAGRPSEKRASGASPSSAVTSPDALYVCSRSVAAAHGGGWGGGCGTTTASVQV